LDRQRDDPHSGMSLKGAARLAAVTSALLLSACGSSGESKADYIKRADAICVAGNRQITAVPMPRLTGLPRQQLLAGLSHYVDAVLPSVEKVVSQLKALPQPSQDQAVLHQYLAALDTAVAQLRTLSVAAARGDVVAVQSGAQELSGSKANTLARQYGFARCGSGANL
jgi:hypothetical protein